MNLVKSEGIMKVRAWNSSFQRGNFTPRDIWTISGVYLLSQNGERGTCYLLSSD